MLNHLLRKITILTVFSFSLVSQVFSQTVLSGYEYRKPVTINSSDIAGTGMLTDFPVLVSITSADIASNATSANGFDIEFTASDGGTRLPHQLVSYDAGTGEVVAWVRMDLDGTSGTSFFIYYGNASVTSDQSSTTTWSNGFEAVYHMDEGTGTGEPVTLFDASSNGRDGTNDGSTNLESASSFINQAQDFDGTNDDIDAGTWNIAAGDQLTISSWVFIDDAPNQGDARFVSKADGTGCANHNWKMGIRSDTDLRFRVTNESNSCTEVVSTTPIPTDVWAHVAVTYDGSLGSGQMRSYINGVLDATTGTLTGNVLQSDNEIRLGANGDESNRFEGGLDEVRISSVARSADWLATEVTNQTNGASFVSASTEESLTPLFGGTASISPSEVVSGNTALLELAGQSTPGTTLQWQSSTDNINFTDVVDGSGANSISYTTGMLTTDTYFRCTVDDGSNTVVSNTVFVTVIESFSSGDGPSGYSLRRKLTIDASEVINANTMVASHTNFPLLVRLTGDKAVTDLIYVGNGGDVAHPSGYDIIFTASDGTTELDHQVESYDPVTGDYVAWVDIDALSATADTELFLYFGNPNVTTDPSANIFDTDYLGTWHLHDQYDDAVSTGNDGIAFGSVANEAGIIANAARFSPVNGTDFSRVEVGDFDPDANNITVSGWFNRDETYTGVNDARIISKSDGQAAGSHTFMMSLIGGNDTRLRIAATEADGTGRVAVEERQDIDFEPGDWVFAAFTYTTNGTIFAYENGIEVDSYPTELSDKELIEQGSGFRVAIGNNPGPADGGDPATRKPFDGLIDEVRVASVVRSDDWLLTEYNNQRENSTFCTVGPKEGCNVSGGSIIVDDENIFTGESTRLDVSGQIGSGIQWQSSTDNITFSDVFGENGTSYFTSALTQTTYFRAVVSDGTCSAVSNITSVNVQGRFLTNYAFRKELTIDKNNVSGSETLTEFPLLVDVTDASLATTANGGNVFDPSGQDITFTDESGNELTQYREEYDPATGKIVVWVKIPTLSSAVDTKLFLYYGNCTGSGLPNLTNSNTWNNDNNADDYAAVWLMDDATPTTVIDATANARNGTGTGLDASSSGQIDGAIDFEADDTSDKITYSSYTSSGDSLTISAWINPESLAGVVGDDAIIISHGDFELKTIFADLAVDESEFSFGVTTGGAVTVESLPSDLETGSFIMVTGVYDGANISLYENGNFIASAAQTGNLAGSTSDILIGNNAGNTLPFDGLIDHVTILPAARSSDWVRTMFNNQSDPNSFYDYAAGDEQSQASWVGGASGAETDYNEPNNWSNCIVPTNTESVILANGLTDYPVLTQNTELVDLIVESGASFGLGGFDLTLTGRLTNNGSFSHNNSTVIFAGTSEQQVTGASSISLHDIELNNNGNEVRFQVSTAVSGAINFNDGFMVVSDNPFFMSSTASVTGASSSSFIITEGTECIKQDGLGPTGRSGDILFPIGTESASYTPITINNTGTDDQFCIRVADGVYSGGTTGSGTRYTDRSLDKTWFVDENVAGGSDVAMTLQWNIEDELTGFDRTAMFIAHFTGGDWTGQGPAGQTAANPSTDVYTVTVSGLTSFSPHTGGSTGSPLPVDLLSFDAVYENGSVKITWSTASEVNNDYFTVSRSTDGKNFEALGNITGAGNASIINNYSIVDHNPKLGLNYYKLRQTDFDGQFEEFRIIAIDVNQLEQVNLVVYPNPSNGSIYTVAEGLASEASVTIEVIDITGKIVLSEFTKADESGRLRNKLALQIPAGLYYLKMKTSHGVLTNKLVIEE